MHSSISIFLILLSANSIGQDIVFPEATSQENELNGPVKTVYLMEYRCDNYVETTANKRLEVTQFNEDSTIEFKEFYFDNAIFLRLDYTYENGKLVHLLEDHRLDNFKAHRDYTYDLIKNERQELSYVDNRLYSRKLYRDGLLAETESFSSDVIQNRVRYDLENGIVHHINDDEFDRQGELKMRWETDFTYEGNKLIQKKHYVKDYIYYKETYTYREDESLIEIVSLGNTLDTIWHSKYDENNNLVWRKNNNIHEGQSVYTVFKYNNNNQLISRESSSMFQNDTTWVYNSNGQLIEEYALRDDEIVSERRWFYENDLISKLSVENKNDNDYVIFYAYDAYGNWNKEMRVNSFGTAHVHHRRIYYH